MSMPLPSSSIAETDQQTPHRVHLTEDLHHGGAEIGGGWLVWQTLRNKRPWYFMLAGMQGCGAVWGPWYFMLAGID